MARWENENLDGLDIPQPPKMHIQLFGALGATPNSEANAFAKKVSMGNSNTYYVLYGRGDLFDPFGADKGKHGRPYFSLKKVKESVFNHYIYYISSEDRIFFTRARRLMMEV